MQYVTASEIKQNSTLLQNALKGDLLVTKRDKPFVVILDYERYLELLANSHPLKSSDWIDDTFGSMSENDARRLLSDIRKGRKNKDINP